MLPLAVRKLSCNPALRRVGHRLHVNHLVRRLYCRLLSASGMLQVSCLGVNAVFKTNNSKQLAFMDYILTSEREAIEAALCTLQPGDAFLDVGCNYGIYSVLASKLVGPAGRVIAVEPHSESLQVLRENLALNGCQNVEVMDVAFSDMTGPVVLAYNENFASLQRVSDPRAAGHAARGMAGDEALRDCPVPAVMKIDVEGHEHAVLSGLEYTLSSPSCRRICLEIHPPLLPSGIGKDDVLKFVRERGFNVLTETARSTDIHIIASR
jgi:FkbM family methyltransferase